MPSPRRPGSKIKAKSRAVPSHPSGARRASVRRVSTRPPRPRTAPTADPVALLQARLQALETEVQHARHRLTIYRQASLGLTQDVSLDKTLHGLAATVAEFFEADAVSFMLWDETRSGLAPRAGSGFGTNYLQHQRIPAKVIQEHVASGRDYLVTLDLRRSPFGRPELIAEERLVSVLSVALSFGGEVLGLLNIYSRDRVRNFTLSEIENARLFAQQAAIAVLNIQLLTQLREEVQIANTLLQMAEDIGSLGTIDEVLNRIVTLIIRALRFRCCAVFLWEKEKHFFLPVKEAGVPQHRSPFFHTLILHRSDLEFTPAERRARTVISSQSAPGRFPVEKISNVLGYRDLFFVPLVVKEQLLGVLVGAGYQGDGPFDAKAEMFFRGIAAQAAIAIDDANLFGELEQAFWDTVRSLTVAIEAKDHYTHDHSEAVIQYGSAIAQALKLPEREVDLVRKACLLHDVGKIGVGDDILRKTAPLTPEERTAIEQHPLIGEQIIASVRSLSEVSRIVRHHHEHYDGNGYPDRLRGDQIPLLSRILQIADSFDAMTSERPYRKALSREQAVAELNRCAGKQFDPELVGVFLKVLDKLGPQPEEPSS